MTARKPEPVLFPFEVQRTRTCSAIFIGREDNPMEVMSEERDSEAFQVIVIGYEDGERIERTCSRDEMIRLRAMIDAALGPSIMDAIVGSKT